MGFSNLSDSNQRRVEQANLVYKHSIRILFALFKADAFVTLENPTRSWLWAILAQLVKEFTLEHSCAEFARWFFAFQPAIYDMCMHGGTKNKSTKLLVSESAFLKLSVECDGNHTHAAWSIQPGMDRWIFSTAAEAEYPVLFCNRYSDIASTLVPKSALDYTSRSLRLESLHAQSIQTSESKQLIRALNIDRNCRRRRISFCLDPTGVRTARRFSRLVITTRWKST